MFRILRCGLNIECTTRNIVGGGIHFSSNKYIIKLVSVDQQKMLSGKYRPSPVTLSIWMSVWETAGMGGDGFASISVNLLSVHIMFPTPHTLNRDNQGLGRVQQSWEHWTDSLTHWLRSRLASTLPIPVCSPTAAVSLILSHTLFLLILFSAT